VENFIEGKKVSDEEYEAMEREAMGDDDYLDTEDINRIALEVLLKRKPATPDTPYMADFRRRVAASLENVPKGMTVALPNE
jgi:hypothetical protein